MMEEWQVGDKALCVDDKPQDADWLAEIPCVAGVTYTVAAVLDDAGIDDRCSLGLRLREVRAVCGRVAFCADRFEKVSA